MTSRHRLFIRLSVLLLWSGVPLRAEDARPRPAAPVRGEALNIDKIKEKYWAKGDESSLRVVQNRTYTKAHRIEFALFGGKISTDPFLSVKSLGGEASYHVSEYFGFGLIGWKSFASGSSSLDRLEQTGATANTNMPSSFLGGQISFSPIYGKLSVLGAMIIYYDMRLTGGAGMSATESGSYLGPYFGIGQKIYLNNLVALQIDYRLLIYNENVPEKANPAAGPIAGSRTSWNDVITLGFSFLL